MSIYEKHNNYLKSTLMSRKKEDLVNYCLMLQSNLIKAQENLDIQAINSKKIVDKLEEDILAWKLYYTKESGENE